MTDYNVPVETTPNPFDQFDAEEKPGERPSLRRIFRGNRTDSFIRGSGAGAAGTLASVTSANDPDIASASQREAESYRDTSPEPREGESPLQAQVRAAAALRRQENGVTVESVMERVARIREELAGYEAMPGAEGFLENTAALFGQLAGGIMSPENLINKVPGAGKLAGRFAAEGLGKEVVSAGLSNAAVNVATDPFVQGMSIKSGVQNEYELSRTAIAGPMGFAFGAGMTAGMHGAGSFIDRTVAAFNQHRLRLAVDDPGFRAPGEIPTETPDVPMRGAPEIDVKPLGDGSLARVVDPQGGESLYHIAKTDEGFIVDRAKSDPNGTPIEGMTGPLDETGNVMRAVGDGEVPPNPAVFASKEDALAFVRKQEGLEPPTEQAAPQTAQPPADGLPPEIKTVLDDVGDALGVPRVVEDIVPLPPEPIPPHIIEREQFAQTVAHLPEHESQAIVGDYEPARAAVTTPMAELPRATPDAITSAPTRAQFAPVGPFVFEASTLRVDAGAMQYKGGGDEFGDIGTLKGVSKWDQAKAGQIMVYQRLNGEQVVANGHQRTSLARRLIAEGYADETPVTGLVYREADGITPSDMRAIAAAENISAGTGSPIDAARIIRERPELLDGSINFGSEFGRKALGLSKLSDEAFAMVNNGVVPENFGAVVGSLLPTDHARQKAALDAIVRFDPANVEQATILTRRVAEAELAKREAGAQGSMFDDMLSPESTAGEEMKIVDRTIKALRKDKTLFQRVVANARRIEETGSRIAQDAAQAVTSDADVFVQRLSHDAYTAGPVRTALVQAARDLKNGKITAEQASRDVLAALRGQAENDVAGRAGGSTGAGAGRAGEHAIPAEAGRVEQGAAVPDGQIPDATKVEPGAEGLPQTLIPGVDPVTDRQRLELQASKPMQGGNAEPPAGGLFDTEAQKQDVLFRAKGAQPPTAPPQTVVAGSTPQQQVAIQSLQQQTFALAETLDMPLRQGRLQNAQAAAQYNARYGEARVRDVADFFSVAHEGGHHIEVNREYGNEIVDLVNQHHVELTPLDYQPVRGDVHEGFSEFFALMLTNQTAARVRAPTFFNKFRALMADRDPKLLAELDAMHQGYRAYLNASSGERIAAQIVSTAGKETYYGQLKEAYKEDGFAGTVGKVVADFYFTQFDDKAPIARAVRGLARLMRSASGNALVEIKAAENPETLMRLFGRSQQGATYQMRYGIVPYHEVRPGNASLHGALSLASNEPTVLARWQQEHIDDLATYALAKRAVVQWDKEAAGLLDRPPYGFSRQDAVETINDLIKKNPNLEQAAQMLHQYSRDLLTKMRDAGLLKQDEFVKISGDEFYVPSYRNMDDKPLLTGSAAGRGSNDGPGATDTIKKFRGSTRDVISPIEGLMMQTFLVERQIRHNDIMIAFKNLADRAGPGAAAIVMPLSGKELKATNFDLTESIRIVAHDRGLDPTDTAILMQSVTNAFGDDPIMGTMFKMELASKKGEPILFYKEAGEVKALRFQAGREGNKLYETLTALPDTMLDTWTTILGAHSNLTRLGVTTSPTYIITNFIKDQMATGILRTDYMPFWSGVRGVWDEIRQNEAAQLYGFLGGVSPGAAASGTHRAMENHIGEIANKTYLQNRLTSFNGLVELPQITEAGTRNSVFAKVYEQKKAMGLSEYEAAIEAAYQATDLLDFGRHGSRTMSLRQLIPFYNAHLQGLDKARRTMLEPLSKYVRGDIVTVRDKEELTNAGWALLKFSALGATAGAAYSSLMSDNEGYLDLTAEQRATHLVIPLPGGHHLFIPKPYELSLGFTAGEMAFQRFSKNDPRMASAYAEGAWQVLKPPNPVTGNPLIKVMAEQYLNRSFFTGRNIVSQKQMENESQFQSTPYTSEMAIQLGKITGMSPIRIDHVIGSLFATNGRDIMSLSNMLSSDEHMPDAWDNAVFIRRFIKNPTRNSMVTEKWFHYAASIDGEFNRSAKTFSNLANGGRERESLDFLRGLTDEKKAYAILTQSGDGDDPLKPARTVAERMLNPIVRGMAANQVIYEMIDRLSKNIQDTNDTREKIQLTPQKRRDITEALQQLGAQEKRNALVIMKEPGWGNRQLLDVRQQFDIIKAISPQIGNELQTEYATKKILPTSAIAAAWPQARKELIKNGSSADLSDVETEASANGYEFGGERGTRRKRIRAVVRPQDIVPASP